MRISDWSSDVCSSDLDFTDEGEGVMAVCLPLDEVKEYYFEDFKPGQVFRTPEFVATAENIISFAKHYDPQYYHLDAERARNSIFEGLVCGGLDRKSTRLNSSH